MARMRKPGFYFEEKGYHNQDWISFKTYRELKKQLKYHLENSREDIITVFRSRRGEWGEWFEKWTLSNNKPVIIEKGWM